MELKLGMGVGDSPGRGGALKFESDGYVPTGERKKGASGVQFHRKKGVIGRRIQRNWAFFFFGGNFPKWGIWCKFCQIQVKICFFQLKMCAKRAKSLKILCWNFDKRGNWVWTVEAVVKNGVTVCKICFKNWVMDMGRHY